MPNCRFNADKNAPHFCRLTWALGFMKTTIFGIATCLALSACQSYAPMPSSPPDSRTEQLRKLAEAEAELPQEVREKLAELRKQSEALPRPSHLDPMTIRSIKDQDIDYALTWYFGECMRTTKSSREATLRGESTAFRAFYLSWLLEAEVLNGGFNQYFWNVSPELIGLTADALRNIGASDALEIFLLATKRGEAEEPRRNELKAQRTLQAFSDSYKLSRLVEYDERFAALATAFAAKRLGYVRANDDKLEGRCRERSGG
jgi:hypothetical protein